MKLIPQPHVYSFKWSSTLIGNSTENLNLGKTLQPNLEYQRFLKKSS